MLPALFNPEKLQTRIVAVYLGLLLVIQAVSYWFIQDSIDRNARTAIRAELTTSERVFLRLLGQNNANLDQATRVLSADYGFRSAVASGDQETVQSALVNNSDRIHANLALFTDNDFQLKASTTPNATHFLAAVRRYASQMQTGGAQQYQVEVIDGQPYQIVAVPVRAPATIGWVGMGFKIDRQLLQDMNSPCPAWKWHSCCVRTAATGVWPWPRWMRPSGPT